MAIQQPWTVRVGGVPLNGSAATAAFTSDAIAFKDNIEWSLNVWFTGLVFTGTNAPTVTIEVSNDDDVNSFRGLDGAKGVKVPEYWERLYSSWKYFRIVYDPKGASAGTKNFDLTQFV